MKGGGQKQTIRPRRRGRRETPYALAASAGWGLELLLPTRRQASPGTMVMCCASLSVWWRNSFFGTRCAGRRKPSCADVVLHRGSCCCRGQEGYAAGEATLVSCRRIRALVGSMSPCRHVASCRLADPASASGGYDDMSHVAQRHSDSPWQPNRRLRIKSPRVSHPTNSPLPLLQSVLIFRLPTSIHCTPSLGLVERFPSPRHCTSPKWGLARQLG